MISRPRGKPSKNVSWHQGAKTHETKKTTKTQ